MERFVDYFAMYLEKGLEFINKEMKIMITNKSVSKPGRNPYVFSIGFIPMTYYEKNKEYEKMSRRVHSIREWMWVSELWIEMDFETKHMIEIKKFRSISHKEEIIKKLFKQFIKELPSDSEEMEMYQRNRKTKRLEWLFEA